ncbi:MAG: hypothetical protein GY906_22305 [bacterium]|nr:hypothetical protein [bacterium]
MSMRRFWIWMNKPQEPEVVIGWLLRLLLAVWVFGLLAFVLVKQAEGA